MAIKTEPRHVDEPESSEGKATVASWSSSAKIPLHGICDACPYCADTCLSDGCKKCSRKKSCTALSCSSSRGCESTPGYTRCQVRRHNSAQSAWLVAGDSIYDATEYMQHHPGGKACILKKAGGHVDCTEDLRFHSRSGRHLWQKYYV
eukprot:CAMPEP_0170348508 /NCGR_PEP_ID=MMETSP0116_2-20130129/75527_1 /TAXON_ID=400756 /ORGANISM="Durinskia baltica, Strain CSIRO CS-38" /LENGTH=147 /DNA_ID=CAMNT_0010602357 /DNA_START=12 /DNA_END=451 /DNA_ORIENTATION=+